jgi:hypothetical protein
MSARTALEEAGAAVATAREAVAAGIFVDLAGLDVVVARACLEARHGSTATDETPARLLLALLAELDLLAGELQAQRDASTEPGPAARDAAVKAYKNRRR